MTPPRWKVLDGAESIIDRALRGATGDPLLDRLTTEHRIRSKRHSIEREIRDNVEKMRNSPMFKLCVFYAVLMVFSAILAVMQKKVEKKILNEGSASSIHP